MSYIGKIKVEVKESSVIKHVEYNYESRELRVKLKTDASYNYIYEYHEVNSFTFFGFLGAFSAGKYYNEVIKKHDNRRVYDTSVNVSKDRAQLQVLASKLETVSYMSEELTEQFDLAIDSVKKYLKDTAKK